MDKSHLEGMDRRTDRMVEIMQELGIDIQPHISKQEYTDDLDYDIHIEYITDNWRVGFLVSGEEEEKDGWYFISKDYKIKSEWGYIKDFEKDKILSLINQS